MRCREVDALWDEMRGECQAGAARSTVESHLRECPPCQELYEEYEGVAYCLSCLPQPEPSCDLAKRVVEHIARSIRKCAASPIALSSLETPIGRLYVGFKENRIAYIGIDVGRIVRAGAASECKPGCAARSFVPMRRSGSRQPSNGFFKTWRVDDTIVDISGLTPFEQAALRAAAQIPPGQVRSYSWVATQIGRPKAARAVGQVMARNPLPLLFPCHRVVDAAGELHNYGYGLEMKARILRNGRLSLRKVASRREKPTL